MGGTWRMGEGRYGRKTFHPFYHRALFRESRRLSHLSSCPKDSRTHEIIGNFYRLNVSFNETADLEAQLGLIRMSDKYVSEIHRIQLILLKRGCA